MFAGRPHLGATTAPTRVFRSLAIITLATLSSDRALAACESCHEQGSNVVVSCLAGNEAEMSIAINPLDPMNLVIAAHSPDPFFSLSTFHSCDRGVTWAIKQLDDSLDDLGSFVRFDPTVTIDAAGNVYVGYGVNQLGFVSLIIAKSTDGGVSYDQSALTIVDGPVVGLDKWIVNTGPDPQDLNQQNVYVAYTHNKNTESRHELHLAASYNAGASFTNVIGRVARVVLDLGARFQFRVNPARGSLPPLMDTWCAL